MTLSYFKTTILVLVIFLSTFLFSFTNNRPYTNLSYIENNLGKLNRAFAKLDSSADNYRKGTINIDSLQKVYFKVREQYKAVEFYLAFHHSDYVGSLINGAPLLHIERGNTTPYILEPQGLQVLDELLFSDNVSNEKYEVAAFSKKLSTSYALLYNRVGKRIPQNSDEISAMRMQLVRIFSLGITGFDTPGSLNAIADARSSLVGMRQFFLERNLHSNSANKNIDAVFAAAINYLEKEKTFKNLDRLHLLKNYIDPLYRMLGEVDKNSDLEALSNSTSWNPKSESIFAVNFLNPYFFTKLTQKEDSEKLRNLGKTLFYDPIISNDEKISCASCHNPEKSFTDAVPKSLSNIKGEFVLRNSPTLLNAVYADRFFYDLRAFTLEQQAEHVIFNPDEFNTAYVEIIKKLKSKKEYRTQFKAVFGKSSVTRENFSKALSSYVLSLQSFNSSFDKYVRGEKNEIADEVKDGFNLFMGKANCATCHFAPTFSGLIPPFFSENESEILGVLEHHNGNKLDEDNGRFSNKIKSENAWIYEKSFKTVTVRNVEFSGPYFHNGAYQSLEDVIDFYNEGGGEGLGFRVQNQTLSSDKLNLTETEKKELIAFMKVLNDNPHSR